MKLFIHSFLPFLFLMSLSFNSFGAVATPSTIAKEKVKKESVFKQISAEEIFTMPKKDIEAKIGRKLKFKEKLGLRIVRKAMKRTKKKTAKTYSNENLLGILSLSFGVAGILALGGGLYGYLAALILGIAALTLGIISVRQGEPKRGLAIVGIVLGIIGILSFFLILLLVVALLNAW